LRAEPREKAAYSGETYNTVNSVQDFLKSKALPGKSRGRGGSAGQWKQGARVKHPKFGFGTILRMEGAGDEAKLTVSFSNYGMKKMIAKYVSLEVV